MPGPLDDFGSISVVVPAYNAERVVVHTLDDIQAHLEAAAIPHEIIVVDDGSSDATARLVTERGRGVRLIRSPANRGKGHAVRTGMLASTLDWAVFTDVDNSTRIHHLDRFAPHAAGADVIIASRRLAQSRIVRQQHRLRQMLGRTFPYIVRTVALPGISDSQCGFKAFRRSAVQSIFTRQRIERFAFDVEILMLARRLGLTIAEAPADWDNPTDSTVRIRLDTFQMLGDVLSCSWRLRSRVPKPLPGLAASSDAARPAP